MLVRERIDPHFDVSRGQSRRAETPRASSARAGRPLDRASAVLGALRPSQLAGILRLSKHDLLATLFGLGAVAAIAANGLVLQSGPHPAPIFALRPLPAVAHEATGAIAQLPRPRPNEAAAKPEPARPADGVPLPRSRPQNPQRTALRADPIADIINPGRQVGAVQRVLNEFGYGPIKVNGAFDDATKTAIERFERDHNLPVTGQNSPHLRRALAAATGATLD
jgi:hypothetical protein